MANLKMNQLILYKKIECVGLNFLNYLQNNSILNGETPIINDNNDIIDENNEITFEDDIVYLRSLDPKDWKNQDHYRVLGLKSLRYKATDEDIKKVYRQKVLKHHPDKRKAQGEEILSDDDYFTCIIKAYEILGTPSKRKSYDSCDPLFDDSLPTQNEIKRDFFKTFDKYFKLNARWSEKKSVPEIGNLDTSRKDVEKFYTFWYQFESWREFSYLDEEEKEKGQDREERRWIDKQNKAARAKRKKEEMARIRNLVDLAYNSDPRIIKFKQEDKEKKQLQKKLKQDLIQQKKIEEELKLKEEQLLKEKKEQEERQKIELKRQEREIQKRQIKKERKTLRDFSKNSNYFTEDEVSSEKAENMLNIEKICETLSINELIELNKEMQSTNGDTNRAKEIYKKTIKRVETLLEEERQKIFGQVNGNSTTGVNEENKTSSDKKIRSEWTNDHLQLLIKAVNLFPAGTNQRWDVVANFINQHGGCNFTAKEVLGKAKDLQKTDFSKNNLKTNVNQEAFNIFEKSKKSNNIDLNDNQNEINKEKSAGSGESLPWTSEEQMLLEQALKTYANHSTDKWDKISECIPNRSKKECMRRYKELVDLVKAKKLAQQKLVK